MPTIEIEISPIQQTRLSAVALRHYGSLELAHADMLRKFIQVAPWAAQPALEWQAPQQRNDSVVASLSLDDALYEQMQATIAATNVAGTVFIHTAFVWWTTCVYPQQPYH